MKRKTKKKIKKVTTKSMINSSLRLLFMRSPERARTMKLANVSRGKYLCNECRRIVSVSYINKHKQKKPFVFVDHIVPYCHDDDWNGKIQRLFDEQNMQVLCKECHDKKTKKEREK